MLLAYLDESYDKRRYWIAAVICPDAEALSLTNALDAVVRASARKFPGIDPFGELHGHALFHGKDDWSSLAAMPRARIGIYQHAFTEIAKHDVRIIIRGVNVEGLLRRYPNPDQPHSIVLMHLLERIDEHAANDENNVIVIADEVPEANTYRKDLWRFQRGATSGYRRRQLTRVIDTIHFAPSTSSRLLRAADLVAYLWYRMDSRVDQDERAIKANRGLWGIVQDKVSHARAWHP
jgi:hypothetical protein